MRATGDKMKTFKQIKEQTVNRVFGEFVKSVDGSVDYDLNSIPEEEWILFITVMELMRSGLEYQKVLGYAKEEQQEHLVKEDINSFYSKLRKHYRSGKRYSFNGWIRVMMELLDELD